MTLAGYLITIFFFFAKSVKSSKRIYRQLLDTDAKFLWVIFVGYFHMTKNEKAQDIIILHLISCILIRIASVLEKCSITDVNQKQTALKPIKNQNKNFKILFDLNFPYLQMLIC